VSTNPKMAVVGLGMWGRNHALAFADNHAADLALVCDQDAARAKSLGEELGVAWTTSVAEVAASDVDAVSVATPDHAHADPVVELLAAGKHVFVEKPPATSLADAERMKAAADASGKLACPGGRHQGPGEIRGLVRTFDTSWSVPDSSPSVLDCHLTLYGDKGRADYDMDYAGLQFATDKLSYPWVPPGKPDRYGKFTHVICEPMWHFVACVRGDARPECTVVVLISHNMEQVLQVADFVWVLRGGHMVTVLPAAQTSTQEVVHYITPGTGLGA
jgi:predicted dehydrogenase